LGPAAARGRGPLRRGQAVATGGGGRRAITYPILRFVHLLGLTLMGAGLIGVSYAYGLDGALPIVPLSGVLVWIALACLAVSFLGAVRRRSGL